MAPRHSPVLQGTLDFIVLQLLNAEPTSGWDLALRIQALSKDVLNVNAGSLYPALYRLEGRDWIRAEWATTDNNRRAKIYSVTAAGRKQLVEERDAWQRFAGALSAILKAT